MSASIIQYQDHVDFDSKGVVKILVIEYSGKMSIEMNINARKVVMLDKIIKIFFNKDTQVQDTLFTYKGWMNIKKATSWGANGKDSASIKLLDSTFQRVSDKWDESEDKWEWYDDFISMSGETRRSITYPYKGIKIKRTPKFRRKSYGRNI
tara:strand:+ start:676 stop:1128 length:453 start_codon:yes stop_codon:yes gene_type:complete